MQSALSIQDVSKEYEGHLANKYISIEIGKGSIFGLLGPNGAGKTTLIRMITRIIGQDSGQILFNGNPMQYEDRYSIGYMPEERGLYKKMKVGEHLVYLARLKGLSKKDALEKIDFWLDKLGISEWSNRKVEELSKGMQQKIQFISTVIHEPSLLILDEPFSGLDPINANLIKEEIHRLNEKGVTIIFSTHRMEQVEAICDEIALISKGEVVLAGKVDELKQQFKKNKYYIEIEGEFDKADLEKFDLESMTDKSVVVGLKEKEESNDLLKFLVKKNYHILEFREILPSLNEIFIDCVENQDAHVE